jgi:putative hydrolase of the HAD superfamily
LNPIFERAFLAVGVEPPLAERLAGMVRETYIDTRHWLVFDDVLPALGELSSRRWTHLVLSNHVPELPRIVNSLGLGKYIHRIFCSAEIGYEKPNPRAFEEVLQFTQGADAVWMVGDSMRSDIAGAETVGIPAILARTPHEDARHCCENLLELSEILH